MFNLQNTAMSQCQFEYWLTYSCQIQLYLWSKYTNFKDQGYKETYLSGHLSWSASVVTRHT